jgi:hypothetical protein
MRRRDFIIGGIATGVAAGLRGEPQGDPAKLARLAVMTYSFNNILKDPAHPDDPDRTLEILDVPQMIADRYGIHHVEFQASHFESTDPPYFKEVRERMKKAKSQMSQICLEFDPLDISATQRYMRLETIDLTKVWIDHAVALGCPRVMVNQGTLAPEVRETAIETLKAIVAYGKSRKVFVTAENRGGGRPPAPANGAPNTAPARPKSPTWEVLVEVLKASGAYANPDIGNFPDQAAREAGLRVMYPLSSGSSHAHYAPERYNEADAIKISKEVGYKGLYSIEAGRNNGPDPYVAVQTIRDAILKAL